MTTTIVAPTTAPAYESPAHGRVRQVHQRRKPRVHPHVKEKRGDTKQQQRQLRHETRVCQ